MYRKETVAAVELLTDVPGRRSKEWRQLSSSFFVIMNKALT
jgi:hypothetical protein